MYRYKMKGMNNTEICFRQLKENGYRILATDPTPDGVAIEQVEVNEKIALVMGNELRGISDFTAAKVDGKVRIPMYGFTESFNISVSAAICLHTLLDKMRSSNVPWQLSPEEKKKILLQWLKKSVRKSDVLEREFLRSIE